MTIDHAANVQFLDPENYQNYGSGRGYRYDGGYATTSPIVLNVPRTGIWHVVIDLGGGAGKVRAAARLISGATVMNARKMQPVIRVAPPGELNAYVVYEHQLDLLGQGTPASLMLNFSLFFLGESVTALGTLWSAPPASDRTYYSF